MKTQHTPGPWSVGIDDEPADGVKGIEINTDDGKTNIGYVMAQEIDHYTPVDRANANLAAAAPMLLETLIEANQIAGEAMDYACDNDAVQKIYAKTFDALKAYNERNVK